MILETNFRSYLCDTVGICIETVRNSMIKKLYNCEIYFEILKIDNNIYDMLLGKK